MPVWKAKMDTVFFDGSQTHEREECEVRIDGRDIVVTYKDYRGIVLYTGRDEGHGHYVLQCLDRHGRATLHHMPHSKFLEGYWREEGQRGFWRIVLGDASS